MFIDQLRVLGVMAALLSAVAHVLGATNGSPTNQWSGYAVTGEQLSVTYVTGSWRVPVVQCSGSSVTGVGIFVGIDGYPGSASTVEQVGTAVYCDANANAHYYAFYEFAPRPPTPPGMYPVGPGDVISAWVSCTTGTQFTVQLTDVTRSSLPLINANQPNGFSGNCSSAEWIVEDPATKTRGLYPLVNFGEVNFAVDSATVAGRSATIGSFASRVAITMTSNGKTSGNVEAVPSSLFKNGANFSVTQLTWSDTFDADVVGSFPSGWISSGNSAASVDNTSYVSPPNSLQMDGVLGGCDAALAFRQILVAPPFTLQMSVRNGNETLTGCHPLRGTAQINTGSSWTTPGVFLFQFDSSGNLITYGGPTLTGAPLLDWNTVTIAYEFTDSNTVSITYWINGQPGIVVTRPAVSQESSMVWLGIAAQEGTAWFDNIIVAPGLVGPLR